MIKEDAVRKAVPSVAKISLFFLFAAISFLPVAAQEELLYQMPPKAIADIVDAPGNPFVIPSPDARTLLVVERPALMSIADLSQPELKLAGLRINPAHQRPVVEPHGVL